MNDKFEVEISREEIEALLLSLPEQSLLILVVAFQMGFRQAEARHKIQKDFSSSMEIIDICLETSGAIVALACALHKGGSAQELTAALKGAI